jgi:hypothetical protein
VIYVAMGDDSMINGRCLRWIPRRLRRCESVIHDYSCACVVLDHTAHVTDFPGPSKKMESDPTFWKFGWIATGPSWSVKHHGLGP